MKLGLRRGTGLFTALVRARLVSKWSHSAILIGDTVYQAAPFKGVYASPLTDNHGFDWFDIDGDEDLARTLFQPLNGASYDWFSLLAFVLPWRMSSSKMFYCHELCLRLMSSKATGRVTPEILLQEVLEWKS